MREHKISMLWRSQSMVSYLGSTEKQLTLLK